MKKTGKLLAILIFAVALICSMALISAADEPEARASGKYFEIYSADPDSGATPVYTETASGELYSKLVEYKAKDTWVKLYDNASLTLSAHLELSASLHIDLNNNTLSINTGAYSIKTSSVTGSVAETIEIKNGILNAKSSSGAYVFLAPNSRPISFVFKNLKEFNVNSNFLRIQYSYGSPILSFTDCNVNFKNRSGATQRFCYLQNPAGLKVELTNSTFTEPTNFNWQSGLLFDLYNSATVDIDGCTFNTKASTTLASVFKNNSSSANVTINVKNDLNFDLNCPLVSSADAKLTTVNLTEGAKISKSSYDLIQNATITNAGTMAYIDADTLESVTSTNAVELSYYIGNELQGTRTVKVGIAPFGLGASGNRYVDSTLYAVSEDKFYADAGLTEQINSITANTDKIYLTLTVYKWAAFSEAPSADNYDPDIFVVGSTTSTEIIDAVKNASVKYIEGYTDIILTSTYCYNPGRDLTIDANNNILTLGGTNTNHTLQPGNGITVTYKDATIKSTTASLFNIAVGSTPNIVLENLVINWTNNVMIDYRGGGTFTAKKCTFNFTGSATTYILQVLTNGNKAKLDMSLTDCNVTANAGVLKNPFIQIANTAVESTVNVKVKGCNFNLDKPAFQNISETSALHVSVDPADMTSEQAASTFISTQWFFVDTATAGNCSFTVGNGAKFNRSLDGNSVKGVTTRYSDGCTCAISNDKTYPYVITNNYATVTFVNGNDTTVKNYVIGYTETFTSTTDYVIVKVDDVNKVAKQLTAWFDEEGNAVTNFAPTINMTLEKDSKSLGYATWAIFNTDETEVNYHSFKDGAALPGNTNDLIKNDGILRLYTDLTYTTTASNGNVYLPNGGVIDLNGFKLTMANFHFMIREAEKQGYTIKNGTLAFSATKPEIVMAAQGCKGSLTFDGVIFETPDSNSFYQFSDLRGGTLNLKNCNYNGNKRLVYGAAKYTEGCPITINVTGGKYSISADTAFAISGNTTSGAIVNININGANFEKCYNFVRVNGTFTTLPTVNVDVKNTQISTLSGNKIFRLDIDGNMNVMLEACKSNRDFTVCDGNYKHKIKLNYAKGYRPVETNGAYTYEVKKINFAVSTSLTLYSDFNINFFINGNDTVNIVGFKLLDGAKVTEILDLETLDDGSKWTVIRGISPAAAADGISFKIEFSENNIGYALYLNYSVIDYATQLLSLTDEKSVAAKPVVASIVHYIATAYTYKGYTAPDALTALMLSENYKNIVPALAENVNGQNNYGGLEGAIYSANLALTGECYYRLNLVAGFNGTLTVNGKKYEIVDGMYDEKTYVDVQVHAGKFNAGLNISAVAGDQTYSGTYTLADYIDDLETDPENNKNLIAMTYALYTYAEQASAYLGK